MKVKKLKKELKNMVELKEFLKNPSLKMKVPVYTEEEVEQRTVNSGDDIVKNPTLSIRVGALETRFDRLDTRIDRIEALIANLAKQMDTRFNNLENGINTRFENVEKRLDNVDARLDYIVKANNLKDSK